MAPTYNKLNVVEMVTVIKNEEGEEMLDHNCYDRLNRILAQNAGGELKKPSPPSSNTAGVMNGFLMHQGKFAGQWKKAWFVLHGSYLYQYENQKAAHPKKAFYVGYVMSERMGAEALAKEAKARYMNKLEEKACSLRINVYSPGKVKILTAASEDTMNEWVAALDKAVIDSCASDEKLLEEKRIAGEKMKPLLMAQAMSEVDRYQNLIKTIQDVGFIGSAMIGDDDPRHSDDIAKSGKMKMLKTALDENVWEKYYFVMVEKTVYYYKSRSHKKANYDGADEEDDDEDDDDHADDMPWKGCFNVQLAAVGSAPTAVSTKAKVFQIKTPLRTFILKARHEVDAEEWMGHICAAQQGIAPEERESKLRVYDVYDDPLAIKLKDNPATVKLNDVLKHPVGLRYFMQHMGAVEADLAKVAKVFKAIEKYKKNVVPERKMKKAAKIFKKYVRGSKFLPKDLQAEIAGFVEEFDFAAQNLFTKVEDILRDLCQSHFEDFKQSQHFATLVQSVGPKMITVSRAKGSESKHLLDKTVIVGRSRENENADNYIHLEDDHKVSREHCKIDAGDLAVLVTDLGSSKGTRLDAKDGKKVMAKIILPGQSLFIGGFILTYQLGVAPPSKKKSSGVAGMVSGIFSKKK